MICGCLWHCAAWHGTVRLNPMGGSFAGRSSLCWLAPLPGRGWRQVQHGPTMSDSLKRLLVLPWFFHPYATCKSHQITTVVNDISITYINDISYQKCSGIMSQVDLTLANHSCHSPCRSSSATCPVGRLVLPQPLRWKRRLVARTTHISCGAWLFGKPPQGTDIILTCLAARWCLLVS
jgi:hypothetical protein